LLVKRDGMALTLTQAASADHAFGTERPDATATTSLGTNSELTLNLSETGTSLSLHAGLAKDQTVPHPSVGAEQQLFGGIKLSASMGRRDDGNLDSRIGASFKRSW
jgi:hypothetical protein